MTDDIVSLSHHDFQPVQSQFKQLVDEFDALGEHCRCIYETARGKVIPQLKSVKFNLLNEDDKRVSSASAFHEEAFNQLQELLDMHTNCSYLLKLHQTLIDLEDSINKLICECSIVGEKENWEKILNVKELKGDCKANNLEVEENYKDINEAVCSSCVDDVVHYLELAEHLFAEQTKFNKDAALVFQSMLHALIRCKDRLAQFVDELWCRWIILELPSKQKDVTPFSNVSIPYPSSIHEQVESNDFFSFSFNACLPSVAQMEKALNNPNSLFDSIFYRLSSDNDDDDVPATSPLCGKSSVLASLKILAKPGLICQLLRIIEALKESKTRIYELFNQIWTYIFKPWLKKVPCVSGSEMGWPELKTQPSIYHIALTVCIGLRDIDTLIREIRDTGSAWCVMDSRRPVEKFSFTTRENDKLL
ncbi:unnamed protein product [Trichobilharzia szidati]|nr:unnamed protein product [Trichobilharzia szidati]